ncbi:hypothetical protein NQT66_11630 [Cellulophaga baltica]|uniref:hypothetical protein n=1 Tax=Cellulophaga baltica TaxID=76594 RepID=UPI002147CFB8|nr:hypothetical protein [Cellulophaga baltica]MCR1025461.1 hypothetical protein [Cellulophaga baltica]
MTEILNKLIEILKDLGPVIVAVVAICLTYRHHKHSKKIANDRMMKELFGEFNKRYDVLNDYLEKITNHESMEYLMNDHPLEYSFLRNKLNDYFNLCAEEYYWFKNGRIDEDLWQSWEVGMNAWYDKHNIIQEAWKEEYKSFGHQSFYLKKDEQFFKNFKK